MMSSRHINVVSMSYRRRMSAENSTNEAFLKINNSISSRNNNGYFVNFPKDSEKSVVSEISNFKINLRTRLIITIKPLSSNFTKLNSLTSIFKKILRNTLEQFITEL